MVNPFTKLLELTKGKGLLQTSGTSVIGIDIGSPSMKIVQLRKNPGKVGLGTYGELATRPCGDHAPG